MGVGMTMTIERPKVIAGKVCHHVRWDREGRIVEARYRPARVAREEARVEVAPHHEAPPTRRRATQAQGSLL